MPKGESQDKFECRNCGCKQSTIRTTQVIEREWKGKKVTIVKRYRVCRFCKLSFTTNEYQYEDAVKHKIPHGSAMRPAYDTGRLVGATEFINGLLKPTDEITEIEQLAAIPDESPNSPGGSSGRDSSTRRRGGSRRFLPSSTEIAARQELEKKKRKR